jgi:hypothetical protein
MEEAAQATEEDLSRKARELGLQFAYAFPPERESRDDTPWLRPEYLTPEQLATILLHMKGKVMKRKASVFGRVFDHMERLSEFAVWRFGAEAMKSELLAVELASEMRRHPFKAH